MPIPLVRYKVAGALISSGVATAFEEKVLMDPKAIILFYVEIAKKCHVATGSKRIACGVAALACGIALVPGAHQGPFIIGCTALARGANKLS